MGLLDKFKSTHKKMNIEAEKAIQVLNKGNTDQHSNTSLDSMQKDINRLSNYASDLQSTPIEHLDDPEFQDTPEEKAFCEFIQILINGNYSRYVSYSETKQVINYVDEASKKLGYILGGKNAGIQTFFNILSTTSNQASLQLAILDKSYFNIELNPETYGCLKAVNQKIDLTQHFIKRASKDYDIHLNYGSVVPQTGAEYWREQKGNIEYMYEMAGRKIKTETDQIIAEMRAKLKKEKEEDLLAQRQSEKVPQANPINAEELKKKQRQEKQEAQMSQLINSLNNKTAKSQKIVYDPNFANALRQYLPLDVDAKPIISVKNLIDTINIIDEVCNLKTFFDVIYSTDDKKDAEFIEETYRRFNERLVGSGLNLDHNNYILTLKSIRKLGVKPGSGTILSWFNNQRGQTMPSEYWEKETDNNNLDSMSFF